MSAALPPAWLDVVACPACRGALDAGARCGGCGAAYGLGEGAPDLVPAALRDASAGSDPGWRRWREALAGLEAWRARRRAALGSAAVDPRIVAMVRDAGLAGTVVDVGGKDGAKHAAMPPAVTRYLSVDPCATGRGEGAPGRLPGLLVVRGLAEALPVRDGAADAVFSTAAMDYFVDPARAVDEFARVLRPGGVLALLVSVHPPAVGRARSQPTRARRAALALAPSVVGEVGARGAVALAADGLRSPLREHTAYLVEGDVLGWLARRFRATSVARDRGAYSTVLRWIGRRA